MSHSVQVFDQWIRNSFMQLNTELEELYFAQADRANVEGMGEALKRALHDEGRVFTA